MVPWPESLRWKEKMGRSVSRACFVGIHLQVKILSSGTARGPGLGAGLVVSWLGPGPRSRWALGGMASRPGAMPLGLSGADPIPFGCWAWGGGLGGAGLGSAGDLSRPPTSLPATATHPCLVSPADFGGPGVRMGRLQPQKKEGGGTGWVAPASECRVCATPLSGIRDPAPPLSPTPPEAEGTPSPWYPGDRGHFKGGGSPRRCWDPEGVLQAEGLAAPQNPAGA